MVIEDVSRTKGGKDTVNTKKHFLPGFYMEQTQAKNDPTLQIIAEAVDKARPEKKARLKLAEGRHLEFQDAVMPTMLGILKAYRDEQLVEKPIKKQ